MKALILAAGQGERLEHLTADIPKALVKVAGLELLRYSITFLDQPAVKVIGVVVGYQAAPLLRFLKSEMPQVAVFENPRFEEGSILSLQSAISFLDDDFLLMNVDHIYPKRLFKKIAASPLEITAVCDSDRPLVSDDMKIRKADKNHLREIDKKLKNYDGGYIGLTFCPKNKIPAYLQGVEKTFRLLGPKANVEKILGELAKEGEKVAVANASGIRWLEVDTLQDLKQTEETLKKNPQFLV